MGINANSLQGKLKGNEKDAFIFASIVINVIQPITFGKLSATACLQPFHSGREESSSYGLYRARLGSIPRENGKIIEKKLKITTYSLLDVNCWSPVYPTF